MLPHSQEAETSVVGQMLARHKLVGEVIGTLLEPEHFYNAACRVVYAEMVARYYADEPIDPLTIGEACAKSLMRVWNVQEREAVGRVQLLATGRQFSGLAVDHAVIVKRDADYRVLLDLAESIKTAVAAETQSPSELAGSVSYEAVKVATSSLLSQDLYSFDEVGARFLAQQKLLRAAREQGIELGAYFGMTFIDSFTRGLRPSELFFLVGDPGAGKSAVAWKAAILFAERQLKRPRDKQIGTLILSLEMAEEPSDVRVGQSVTALDGGKLREGRSDDDDLRKIMDEWKAREGLPLWFNYSSNIRASQMRALCVESVRRHNVGVIIIDHFRYIDMDPATDGRRRSTLEAEEELARYLKQDLATQLNVAVICLAHTTKAGGSRDDPRPTLSDLRGGQLVAGHADYVAFVFRPYSHAGQDAIDEGTVKRTDAEMHYKKNRHGLEGMASFYFDPSTMNIY